VPSAVAAASRGDQRPAALSVCRPSVLTAWRGRRRLHACVQLRAAHPVERRRSRRQFRERYVHTSLTAPVQILVATLNAGLVGRSANCSRVAVACAPGLEAAARRTRRLTRPTRRADRPASPAGPAGPAGNGSRTAARPTASATVPPLRADALASGVKRARTPHRRVKRRGADGRRSAMVRRLGEASSCSHRPARGHRGRRTGPPPCSRRRATRHVPDALGGLAGARTRSSHHRRE